MTRLAPPESVHASATGRTRLLTLVPWAVALLLALAPVLLVRAAVTVDGPTHLYNAWVAAELARDPTSPLADAYAVRPAIGQMVVSGAVLRALGPVVGWDGAERVWLGVLLAALLAALGWSVRRSVPDASASAPLVLVWVPLGWVTAWGFYDFLAGMVLFTLLLDALDDGGRARIVPLMALLYFVHLFAFAASVGVLVLRSIDRPDLRATAAAVAVAGAGLVLAAPGLGGGMTWDFSFQSRLFHLAFGGILVSVSPVGILAGLVWTGLLVTGALRVRWDWRCRAGFLLLAGSIVAPTSVGNGSFLFERLHVLGLIALAPLVVGTITRLPRLLAGAASLALIVAALAVFGTWTEAGRQLDQDRRQITALLGAAGVEPGAAVAAVFPHRDMSAYRARVTYHMVDRSALDLGLIVADNYQAITPAFPISWADDRRAVEITQQGQEWAVSGAIDGTLYVVHRADARWYPGRTPPLADDGRFAVTRLTRAEPAPPDATRNDP
jgi:hypothetical protein